MKKILINIFRIGFTFFGGGFPYSFLLFTAYIGFGELFEYKPAQKIYMEIDAHKIPARLLYEYSLNNKTFKGSQNVSTTCAKTIDKNSLVILCNQTFPSLIMIEGLTGKTRRYGSINMECLSFSYL